MTREERANARQRFAIETEETKNVPTLPPSCWFLDFVAFCAQWVLVLESIFSFNI